VLHVKGYDGVDPQHPLGWPDALKDVLCQKDFFWTEQYDFGIAYVGHAERWNKAEINGSLDRRDCTITYRRAGKKLAVVVVHRDLEGLRAEVEFERAMTRNNSNIQAVQGSASMAHRAETASGGS
jgi:hypothetical protein